MDEGSSIMVKSVFEATLYDVNTLIQNMQTKTEGAQGPCYENLAEEWCKMKFSKIFNRHNPEEIIEFTPLTFLAAKVNLLPPIEIKRRLYGLLVLYGLYSKQPCLKVCRIPVAHKEWNHLTSLFEYCASNNYKEHCFIFESLWSQHAFEFVFSPVDLSFLVSQREPLDDLRAVASEAILPESEAEALSKDACQLAKEVDLTKVADYQKQYNEIVSGISGLDGSDVANRLQGILDIIPKKPPKYIKFVNSNLQKIDQEQSTSREISIGERRRSLIGRSLTKIEPSYDEPAPSKARREVDPNYDFIQTLNGKGIYNWMNRKLKRLKQEQRMLEEEERQDSTPTDGIEAEALGLMSNPDGDVDMQCDQTKSLSPQLTDELTLATALSMPIVQWNDPE
ncbi:uncharacterized protein LOC135934547 [Cloeon dipterum]|uniref:uncharacterized protein LOC135934547 n=1 Tax=Cloeon dipterum TaxID=197152 RepID=UPI003220643D